MCRLHALARCGGLAAKLRASALHLCPCAVLICLHKLAVVVLLCQLWRHDPAHHLQG